MDQKDQESAARKKAILEDAQREIADYMDERQKRTRKNREKHEYVFLLLKSLFVLKNLFSFLFIFAIFFL